MQNNLGSKFIIVSDVNILKLFEAKGVKIVKPLGVYNIHCNFDHREKKRDGFSMKKSTRGTFYDPRTQIKDIEYQESSRNAAHHIEKLLFNNNDYKEVIIVAEAKMLGALRNNLTSKVSKLITKEIDKDMVKHNIEDIEKAIFG